MLGGYKVQGKSRDAATHMLEQALACQEAGAQMVVLEEISSSLGEKMIAELHIPTIVIGARPDCSGQVLVLQDMLGISPGRPQVREELYGKSPIDRGCSQSLCA